MSVKSILVYFCSGKGKEENKEGRGVKFENKWEEKIIKNKAEKGGVGWGGVGWGGVGWGGVGKGRKDILW